MSKNGKKWSTSSKTKTAYARHKDANLSESIFSNKFKPNARVMKTTKMKFNGGNLDYNKSGENSNINITRRLPEVMKCNGVILSVETKEKTTTEGVGKVTAFASFFKTIDGVSKNSLMDNVIKTIDRLGRGNTVLICMAWLSHRGVLNSLKSCRRVLAIVNKEDYSTWGGGCMKTAYNDLPRFDEPLWKAFSHLNTPLCSLDRHLKNGKSSYAPVRAFGSPSNMSSQRASRYNKYGPSSNINSGFEHCKFFVFFKKTSFQKDGKTIYLDLPNSVLTCSSNMTKTSETHHENAILIEDNPAIAEHYMLDHNATFMGSVPVYSKGSNQTPMKRAKWEQ